MNALWQHVTRTLSDGGPVVLIILALSVLLYTRCFTLLLHLYQARQQMIREHQRHPGGIEQLRILQDNLHDMFERQRAVLAAMIAAAPLLGLLGTVTGMINTFSHLASRVGKNAMEGLAQGISEALIATMTGLAVAIPGVLLLYVAYRELQKSFQTFARFEHQILEGR